MGHLVVFADDESGNGTAVDDLRQGLFTGDKMLAGLPSVGVGGTVDLHHEVVKRVEKIHSGLRIPTAGPDLFQHFVFLGLDPQSIQYGQRLVMVHHQNTGRFFGLDALFEAVVRGEFEQQFQLFDGKKVTVVGGGKNALVPGVLQPCGSGVIVGHSQDTGPLFRGFFAENSLQKRFAAQAATHNADSEGFDVLDHVALRFFL